MIKFLRGWFLLAALFLFLFTAHKILSPLSQTYWQEVGPTWNKSLNPDTVDHEITTEELPPIKEED